MEQTLNILLGAGIASIVPVVTLIISHLKWKKEKKIEILRLKHDKLEKMYSDILLKLPDSLSEQVWSTGTTSKISVFGSKSVRDIYFNFSQIEDKDDYARKKFYLDMSVACNKHINEVQNEIENML